MPAAERRGANGSPVVVCGHQLTSAPADGHVYRHPWRKVKTAERSMAWWHHVGRNVKVHWFIETECGHFMFRSGKDMKAPKRVRCSGCLPE